MVIMCTIKGIGVTSCRAICIASALLFFPGPTHLRSIRSQTSEIVSPNAVIETDPNLVLGFSSVVKVNVYLTSRTTGEVFEIWSLRLEDNECESGCMMWVEDYRGSGDEFCSKCLKEMRKDSIY